VKVNRGPYWGKGSRKVEASHKQKKDEWKNAWGDWENREPTTIGRPLETKRVTGGRNGKGKQKEAHKRNRHLPTFGRSQTQRSCAAGTAQLGIELR